MIRYVGTQQVIFNGLRARRRLRPRGEWRGYKRDTRGKPEDKLDLLRYGSRSEDSRSPTQTPGWAGSHLTRAGA